jgi:hypothetical protein
MIPAAPGACPSVPLFVLAGVCFLPAPGFPPRAVEASGKRIVTHAALSSVPLP